MIIYKIRRKTDGLFSNGGSTPSFTKKGKTWQHEGHMNRHLKELHITSKEAYIRDCEIVTYELIETEQDESIPLVEHLQKLFTDKEKFERDKQERINKYKKDQRRREYKLLLSEFGDEND